MSKAMNEEGRIVAEPLPDDLLKAGRGLLNTKGEVLKNLLADRGADRQ
jgi:hypothetical protein